jgi:hypothetical protein
MVGINSLGLREVYSFWSSSSPVIVNMIATGDLYGR